MMNSLPIWLQYVQIGALLLLTAVGVWIALQQMLIARAKLQHDLFDRRHRIFHAARTFLGMIIATAGHIKFDDLIEFNSKTLDAEFLLDQEVAEYLAQLSRRAAKLAGITEDLGLPAEPNLDKDLVERVQWKWDEVRWFNEQVEVLKGKFASFLRFKL